MRAIASHASWIAALIAVVIILTAQDRVISHGEFGGFVKAGMLLVVLATAGLIAGVVGLVFNLRPARLPLLVSVIGIAANGLLLWFFARPVIGLYF